MVDLNTMHLAMALSKHAMDLTAPAVPRHWPNANAQSKHANTMIYILADCDTRITSDVAAACTLKEQPGYVVTACAAVRENESCKVWMPRCSVIV
jgi:hypothetical protein